MLSIASEFAAVTAFRGHWLQDSGRPPTDGCHRSAAVKLQGTEGAAVVGCVFDRLGGNGLIISGYNRNATVRQSSFRKLGDSAVLLVGDAELLDTLGGDHPRHTLIEVKVPS